MKYLRLILFVPITSFAQLRQVLPIDQSDQDPELCEFIESLHKATILRDTSFIINNISEMTYTPFEGGERTNKEAFINYYFTQQENYSDTLWLSLEDVFSIGGGAFNEAGANENEYFMPYISSAIYNDDYFSSLAVVVAMSSEVKLYEKPDTNSRVIKTLNYEVIPLDEERFDSVVGWEVVLSNEGQIAYALSSEVEYTVSNRCGLLKENGLWKLQYSGSFH